MILNNETRGLSKLGILNQKNIKRNLPVEDLVKDILDNNEGVAGLRGSVMVDTGIYTGRSPKDK